MPIDLTLILEMNGIESVIDYVERLKLPEDERISLDGETLTVAQLKREHSEHIAKQHTSAIDWSI